MEYITHIHLYDKKAIERYEFVKFSPSLLVLDIDQI